MLSPTDELQLGLFETLGLDFDFCFLVIAEILSSALSNIGKTPEYLVRKLIWTVLVTGKQMHSVDLNMCQSCNENGCYEISVSLPSRLQGAGSQNLHVAINSCFNDVNAHEMYVCPPLTVW